VWMGRNDLQQGLAVSVQGVSKHVGQSCHRMFDLRCCVGKVKAGCVGSAIGRSQLHFTCCK
jgi:hypothetical protein